MDFVIIANLWSATENNPTSKHQIALELARQGHRVLWVEGAGMRRPNICSGVDWIRIIFKLKNFFKGAKPVCNDDPVSMKNNIWVLTPFLMPFPSISMARLFNGWFCRKLIKKWIIRLGFKKTVLINYVPVLAGCMKDWRAEKGGIGKVVYHCVDRWDAFEMYDSFLMKSLDKACCDYADIVIVSSRYLYDRCALINDNVHLIEHGVDYNHFSRVVISAIDGENIQIYPADREYQGLQRPADLPQGRIIGFFGLLSEWIDQDLLVLLARALSDCHIVLIGSSDVCIDKLTQETNIHILGSKPFKSLPDYIAFFNAGIIPFIVNDLTMAVNPIKLREMLAVGCPVISTALLEVERYVKEKDSGFCINIAHNYNEFIDMAERRIKTPLTNKERKHISENVAGETWSTKVSEIVKIINKGKK